MACLSLACCFATPGPKKVPRKFDELDRFDEELTVCADDSCEPDVVADRRRALDRSGYTTPEDDP